MPGAFRRVDWGTLLLFGGGLSLGAMMFDSALARALGEAIFAHMPVHGMAGIVLASTLMAVLVSELTSNTASASLVVPVVLALSQVAGVDPVKPALAATVACSFGFMLPVSTPPNALVYSTGRVSIREMMAAGVVLDLGGIVLVFAWVMAFISAYTMGEKVTVWILPVALLVLLVVSYVTRPPGRRLAPLPSRTPG